MKLFAAILRELFGMFVNDGYFALAILGIVLMSGGLAAIGAPLCYVSDVAKGQIEDYRRSH
jgi:hypothetical protein